MAGPAFARCACCWQPDCTRPTEPIVPGCRTLRPATITNGRCSRCGWTDWPSPARPADLCNSPRYSCSSVRSGGPTRHAHRHNARAVADIRTRLDDLPLAIELAAALTGRRIRLCRAESSSVQKFSEGSRRWRHRSSRWRRRAGHARSSSVGSSAVRRRPRPRAARRAMIPRRQPSLHRRSSACLHVRCVTRASSVRIHDHRHLSVANRGTEASARSQGTPLKRRAD